MIILDTDILINYFRGKHTAADFISEQARIAITSVNYMELLQGIRNKNELQQIRVQLQAWRCPIIQMSREISFLASFYLEKWALSHGMNMADALIAATAVRKNASLASANIEHYHFIPDLKLIKFNP